MAEQKVDEKSQILISAEKQNAILDKLNQILMENHQIMGDNKALLEKVNELESKHDQVKSDISQIKQAQYDSMFLISGIPADKKHDNLAIVKKICDFLGLSLKPSDVKAVISVKDKNRPKNFVLMVTMNERKKKAEIMAARRGKSIEASAIGLGKEKQFIFVNDFLVKENYEIIKYARSLKTVAGFRYVWSEYGRVLAKKKEGDKSVLLTSKECVDKLIAEHSAKNMEKA